MNIQYILNSLRNRGFTDAAIAKAASMPGDLIAPSIINRLRRGVHKETNYTRHARIADLYSKSVKKNSYLVIG